LKTDKTEKTRLRIYMAAGFNIRMVNKNDLPELLELYLNLYDSEIMPINAEAIQLWENILSDPAHYILIGEEDGAVVSSLTLIITKSLTRKMSPNAMIENMVTLPSHRNRGYARLLINRAVEISRERGCYRLMFISGTKNESTVRFYINSGFTNSEKYAYVMKL